MKILLSFIVLFITSLSGYCQIINNNSDNYIGEVISLRKQKEKTPKERIIDSSIGNRVVLEKIKITTDTIAYHTRPQKLLGFDNININMFALVSSIMAAFFGFLGYIYQKKSAKTLKEIQPKRIPYMTIADSIYTNLLLLDILLEAEESKDKEKRREIYDSKRILRNLKMPDDLIELSCYEAYRDNTIYSSAYSMKMQWRKYNYLIDDIILKTSNIVDYSIVDDIRKELYCIFESLTDFENKIRKEEREYKKKNRREMYCLDSSVDFLLSKISSFMMRQGGSVESLYNPRLSMVGTLNTLIESSSCKKGLILKIPVYYHWSMESSHLKINKLTQYFWNIVVRKKDRDETLFIIHNNYRELTPLDREIFNRINNISKDNVSADSKEIQIYFESKLLRIMYNNYEIVTRDIVSSNNITTRLSSIFMALGSAAREKWGDDKNGLIKEWLYTYYLDKENGDKMNVKFLLDVVDAENTALIRKSILLYNKDLLSKEQEYFKEIREKYKSFGFFYSQSEHFPDCSATLYNLLSAIVAEQSLSVSIEYLINWKYNDPLCLDSYVENYPEINLLNGKNIVPLLELLGIYKGNGELITDVNQLSEALKDVPIEILNEPITRDSSWAYVKKLGLWCINKYEKLPFYSIYEYKFDKGVNSISIIDANIDAFMDNYGRVQILN